jgi:hypothetical protein
MPRTTTICILAILMVSMLISSCSGIRLPEGAPTSPAPVQLATQPAVALKATEAIDKCASIDTKRPEIERIANIMGEFDDTSFLAQSVPDSGQLVQVILVLQRVRRDAINNKPPECLKPLKEAQVNFMSGVILTFISFMTKAKTEAIQNQITQTRSLRGVFDQELANQLGLKYITATPMPTIAPTPIPPTSTVSPVTATTDQDIYILQGPGVAFPAAGTFLKGQIANVIGRNPVGDWILIEIPSNPGKPGWALKQLIKISGAEASVPIITPEPTQQPAQ